VSGSVQIDVMSTTNIARLATTGSNVFTSNQIITGSVTTTSNVGVGGVPSGTYGTLSVFGGISIKDNNNAKLEIGRYSSGASNSYIKLGANSNSLRFTNAGDIADIMELTNSGSLGLGVTPSAWGSGVKALQIGARMSVYNDGSNNALFGNNTYYNGSNNYYINTAAASRFYLESSNAFIWQQAASGTAGDPITFTTAMTLTSAGDLTLGSAVAATNVNLNINGVANKAARIQFQQSGVNSWLLGNGAASEDNNFELYNSNGTMAMKINKTTNAIAFGGNAISLTGANPSITLTGSASHLYSYVALNAGTASNVIYTMAETYNQFGPYKQSALALIGTTSGGISVASTDVNGGVRLYTGGNTLRAEIDQYGYFYTYNSTSQNGLWTITEAGFTTGQGTFNLDVGVGDEGGGGNIFKVEAGFAHYYGMGYNCLAEFYVSSRGPSVEITDVIRRDTALAGSFTASKLNNSTLRVTKNAGSYPGGGKYWIRVTKVTY
jgi:hypothetical protein